MSATLEIYVQAVAEALDDWQVYACVQPGSPGSSVTIPALIDITSSVSAARYDGMHLANLTTPGSFRVTSGGYTPSTGKLAYMPSVTAPVTNDRIAMTQLFPFFGNSDGSQETSYQRLVNHALQRILLLDQIVLDIVPLQTAYPISPYQYWFDREERFGWPDRLLPDGSRLAQPKLTEPGPTPNAVPVPADWRRPVLRFDADIPYLEITAPFAAGTTGQMRLRVQRPADSWCAYTGVGVWTEAGGYADPGPGLLLPVDAARPPVTDVKEVALEEAYRMLMNRGASAPSGINWRQKYLDQRERARSVHGYDRSSDQSSPAQPAPQAAA